MHQQSSCLLKPVDTSPYKLVFHETEDELDHINKDKSGDDGSFERCSDFEYEIGDSINDLDSHKFERLQRFDSLKRYNKRKRRLLPKIPENKRALGKIIGSESRQSKITRQISNTLYLQIELNDQKKPISLSLINQELSPKQINCTIDCNDKSNNEIDYRPLSEQLNTATEPTKSDDKALNTSANASNGNQRIEGNYRGLHKFIARHDDEISIDIGDEIYVIKQEDDLWFKGINLASNLTGYFPSLYVIDCNYNELFQTVNYFGFSDDDSGLNCECSNDDSIADLLDAGRQCYQMQKERFYFQFLGSLEVAKANGNDVLEQCIQKVSKAYKNRQTSSFLCIIEITDFGLRFFNQPTDDLTKESDVNNGTKSDLNNNEAKSDVNNNENKSDLINSESKSERTIRSTNRCNEIDYNKLNQIKKQEHYFFHLKNITFCGHLESNEDENYFAFITQHPKLKDKLAAHVFISYDAQTSKDICEAIGESIHRFLSISKHLRCRRKKSCDEFGREEVNG